MVLIANFHVCLWARISWYKIQWFRSFVSQVYEWYTNIDVSLTLSRVPWSPSISTYGRDRRLRRDWRRIITILRQANGERCLLVSHVVDWSAGSNADRAGVKRLWIVATNWFVIRRTRRGSCAGCASRPLPCSKLRGCSKTATIFLTLGPWHQNTGLRWRISWGIPLLWTFEGPL